MVPWRSCVSHWDYTSTCGVFRLFSGASSGSYGRGLQMLSSCLSLITLVGRCA